MIISQKILMIFQFAHKIDTIIPYIFKKFKDLKIFGLYITQTDCLFPYYAGTLQIQSLKHEN